MLGSECVWAFGEGSNFQLVRGPQNWVFKQKEQFDPSFCWKLCRLWCCPFVCSHGLEIAIPGDSYLNSETRSLAMHPVLCMMLSTPPPPPIMQYLVCINNTPDKYWWVLTHNYSTCMVCGCELASFLAFPLPLPWKSWLFSVTSKIAALKIFIVCTCAGSCLPMG